MFFETQGFGLHTSMSSSPLGANMKTYTGYKNHLYGYPSLFMTPNMGCGYPMMGGYGMEGCHHNCGGGGDDGFGKAMLWSSVAGIATGLVIVFAKPIGKFFGMVGKGIWTGMKAAGKAIGKAATWCWNGMKDLFTKKPKAEKVAEPPKVAVKSE